MLNQIHLIDEVKIILEYIFRNTKIRIKVYNRPYILRPMNYVRNRRNNENENYNHFKNRDDRKYFQNKKRSKSFKNEKSYGSNTKEDNDGESKKR